MTLTSELQQKLKDFRKSLNLNQTEFAEALKVAQGTIANIESGKRDVSKPIMIKIKDVYNVDLLSYNEVKQNKSNNAPTDNAVTIKFYKDAKAAAGIGSTLPETSEEEILNFDRRWLENIIGVKAENTIIIQAKGNSMDSGTNSPKDIHNGDLLFVDISVKDIINNKVFVIQQNNELRVKRLVKDFNGDIYLISNNEKEYPPELVKQETTIIGRVVWNLSKENI